MRSDWQERGAFVVQFGPDTNVAAGRVEGRIEHVVSLRCARFHSLYELFAFVQEALADAEAKSPEENRET